MFEQSLLPSGRTRRWTVGVALLIEAVVVGILVLIPLLYVQAIPMPDLVTALTAPAPPPPPPPPAAPKMAKITSVRKFDPKGLTAPREIPKEVAQMTEPVIQSAPDMPSVGGVMGGRVGGLIGSVPSVAPPPPPPPAKVETPAATRIQVGGQVQAAMILNQVQPVYPRLASSARISGEVRLKAVISKDGRIEDLKLISGHPLLVQAAMDAVKQWTYKPTVLNGNPVEVDTEIDVNFALSS
jgi:protein TonB